MNKKRIQAFLGISFILLAIGFVLAPLSVTLYVDSYGNWEWEEYFDTDNYIYQSESFRDIHFSNQGLCAIGDCEKDENGVSGVYGSISYKFTSETEITKAVLDISLFSESQQCATKILLNDTEIEMFYGEKTIDITNKVQGDTQFTLTLQFWAADCLKPKDLYVQHVKVAGTSEIPEPDPEPTWIPPDDNTVPGPQKIYYRLSEYIRNEENGSLYRHLARCLHGWLHLLKSTTGVVI